jgi:hypothetical protein
MVTKIYRFVYSRLLDETIRKKIEVVIISVAIFSFIVHLLLVALNSTGVLQFDNTSKLFHNPVAAIYTPFSFILFYEVYLLVFYLPKSTTSYIRKQYEIITLILIRGIFKDMANLQFTADWFSVNSDLKFTLDLGATIILFLLIYFFNRISAKSDLGKPDGKFLSAEMIRFIRLKNIIAICLVPVFLALGVWDFILWVHGSFFSISEMVLTMKDANSIFFNEFFTVLIMTDVLLLLISFLYTDKFNKVIRNSGFVISTILIKLSFSAEGILNTLLIVVAVLFGLLILLVHNQYEKLDSLHSG